VANGRAVRRLPGFRDSGGLEQAARETAVQACRRRFDLRGYERLETPYLEETELFLRKSGGELASRLCSFTDPAGYPVSLRPEFTAPVLRHAIEGRSLQGLPLRIQYAGPVFRYAARDDRERSDNDSRQFTQGGAELIGGAGPRADGEILAMAWEGLRVLGVPAPLLVLGHVGLLWDLIRPFGLSERGRLFLVSRVDELRGGPDAVVAARAQARDLGLLPGGPDTASRPADSGEPESLELVESVLGRTVREPVGRSPGARSPEEIIARLARKIISVEETAMFDDALELLGELATVRGELDDAIEKGRAVARRRNSDDAPFDQIARTAGAAQDEGVPKDALRIDFGLARGIAYYTGMVFDLTGGASGAPDPKEGGGASLGGGGRYDGLPRALGAESDIPALGFAYDLDAVLDAAAREAEPPAGRRVVVAPDDGAATAAAARHAAQLRDEGVTVLLEVEERSSEEMKAYGKTRGASEAAFVSADGAVRMEAI